MIKKKIMKKGTVRMCPAKILTILFLDGGYELIIYHSLGHPVKIKRGAYWSSKGLLRYE